MSTGTVCVYGLWHLGAVTAACLAGEGIRVVGLDPDEQVVAGLASGRAPISESGLDDLVRRGLDQGRLSFTTDLQTALAVAEILWVTFDTPVDDDDHADVDSVRAALDRVRPYLQHGTLILVSSQVPVGFTTALEREWRRSDPSLQFACSPENLRLGRAIDAFRQPERVVVGVGEHTDRDRLTRLFSPFCEQIEWMSLPSAEMTKHALNGFLALSVTYANELARICERVGADASEVERALRSEPRIGRRAYISPGSPLAGGTLLRDIGFLSGLAGEHRLVTPVVDAVRVSNTLHQRWALDRALELLAGVEEPRAAVLGLTYKPGTNTLRRSSAVELARELAGHGIHVTAYDPAVRALPDQIPGVVLTQDRTGAVRGADVAILATAWPELQSISVEELVRQMRTPRLIDQAGFLPHLAGDARLQYVRVGQPAPPRGWHP